jgi:DNA-directed RNA polymerase subunit omega
MRGGRNHRIILSQGEKAPAMARITVEDCLKQIDNRFAIVHVAANRVRQLNKGATRLVNCKNENVVTALREVAEGKVEIAEKKRK